MAGESVSVNYSVDARIVGSNPINDGKLAIMSERQYNLRIVPFAFGSALVGERGFSEQLKRLTLLVQERLAALENVFCRLRDGSPITNVDIHGTDLSGYVDANTELDSDEILRRKVDQLHVLNRMDGPMDSSDIADFKGLASKSEGIVESELNYRIKGKSNSGSRKGLFAGFQAALTGSSLAASSSCGIVEAKVDKLGMILATVKIPQKSLAYWSPSLLRKTNLFEKKTKHAQENWMRLLNLLPEEERTSLTDLDIQLTCIQSNNSVPHEPAEIQAVTTELFCITVTSENSIPTKLNSQQLMDEKKLNDMKETFRNFQKTIQDYQRKFSDNNEKLNELYNINRTVATARELKFSNFITQQIYNDVESLANLKVNVTCLSNVFKKQAKPEKLFSNSLSGSTLKPSSSSSSSLNNNNNVWRRKSNLQYERDLNVNLEFNRNLIQTLVPSFESCLCSRFYSVRVNIKFHHLGTLTIDVPISVKNFVT